MLALVLNPAAGNGRSARWLDPVRRKLTDAGHEVVVVHETDAEATLDKARAAVDGGAAGVVSIGGDGLAHLLLPLVAGTDTPLGLVPVGTGNDLAAGLGVPADPLAAADAIANGRTRTVDLGRAGDRWWASIMCAGFDSAVNERANAMRWPRGPRRYDIAVLAEVATLAPRRMTIVLDGKPWETDVILVAVGNTARYGGGLHMCPTAVPDDGTFDVTIIGPVKRRTLVRMLPKVRTGGHLSHPAVTVRRAKSVRLIADGTVRGGAEPISTVAYADGERIGPLPVTTECVPAALQLFVP